MVSAMDVMNEVKDMLYDELEGIVSNTRDMSKTTLYWIGSIVDTIKDIHKIEMLQDYDATESYYGSRGRRRSRTSRSDRSRDSKDAMFDKLQQMMDEAPTQEAKDAYQCCMDMLRDMR